MKVFSSLCLSGVQLPNLRQLFLGAYRWMSRWVTHASVQCPRLYKRRTGVHQLHPWFYWYIGLHILFALQLHKTCEFPSTSWCRFSLCGWRAAKLSTSQWPSAHWCRISSPYWIALPVFWLLDFYFLILYALFFPKPCQNFCIMIYVLTKWSIRFPWPHFQFQFAQIVYSPLLVNTETSNAVIVAMNPIKTSRPLRPHLEIMLLLLFSMSPHYI